MGKLETQMKKASFFINEFYLNNIIFNNSSTANRDNCLVSYIKLKGIFLEYGYDLSTYDINPIEKSEIVIYNDMPKILPNAGDIAKSYLIIFESELICPDNWDMDKHKYFHKIFTWNDELIDNRKYFKLNFSHLFPDSINKDLSKKEKLCTLIAGNKIVEHSLELYTKRVEAIRWFEKNHPNDFDFYGMGWDIYIVKNRYLRFLLRKTRLNKVFKTNYPSYKGKVDSKKPILEKYKFAICYENAKDISGYITEKIFDCFFAGTVPIYWGANNITEHIPKECFIDKREYKNYDDLYEVISNMKDSDYLEYINNIDKFLKSDASIPYRSETFANIIVNNTLNQSNDNS